MKKLLSLCVALALVACGSEEIIAPGECVNALSAEALRDKVLACRVCTPGRSYTISIVIPGRKPVALQRWDQLSKDEATRIAAESLKVSGASSCCAALL